MERQQSFLARSGDPSTSHQAAEALDVTRAEQTALMMVRRFPGKTGMELDVEYRAMGGSLGAIHKRLRELERRDLLREGPVRRCTISGRNAVTWLLKDSSA